MMHNYTKAELEDRVEFYKEEAKGMVLDDFFTIRFNPDWNEEDIETEPLAYLGAGDNLSISLMRDTMRTIAREIPITVFILEEAVSIPASRWEPEDVSINEIGRFSTLRETIAAGYARRIEQYFSSIEEVDEYYKTCYGGGK